MAEALRASIVHLVAAPSLLAAAPPAHATYLGENGKISFDVFAPGQRADHLDDESGRDRADAPLIPGGADPHGRRTAAASRTRAAAGREHVHGRRGRHRHRRARRTTADAAEQAVLVAGQQAPGHRQQASRAATTWRRRIRRCGASTPPTAATTSGWRINGDLGQLVAERAHRLRASSGVRRPVHRHDSSGQHRRRHDSEQLVPC